MMPATNWDAFQQIAVDFAPDAPIQVNATNNFIVIPEPRTGSYMLLFLALAGGVYFSLKRVEPRPATAVRRRQE